MSGVGKGHPGRRPQTCSDPGTAAAGDSGGAGGSVCALSSAVKRGRCTPCVSLVADQDSEVVRAGLFRAPRRRPPRGARGGWALTCASASVRVALLASSTARLTEATSFPLVTAGSHRSFS